MSDGEVLSRNELLKLLQVTPPETSAGIRNRALLVALFGDGRKIDDVLDLTGYEAEWEDFAPGYRDVVDAWLAERDRLGLERFGPVFSSVKGDRLTAPYVRGLVKRTRSKAAKLPDSDVSEEEALAAPAPLPQAPEPESEPEPEPEPEAAEPEPLAAEPEPEPSPPAQPPETAEPVPTPPEPPVEPQAVPPPAPVPPPPTPAPEQPAAQAPGPPPQPRAAPQFRPPRYPSPPRGGFWAGRSPLALVTIAAGIVLLAGGGIAAAVALTRDSSSNDASTTPSTHTATTHATTTAPSTATETTAPTTTEQTTGTTTAAPPPAAGTLAFIPGQSYCQLQAHHQLGFWITLQNKGGDDLTDVALVAVETYGGTAHANRKIPSLTVPANQPRLQTVVSYQLPAGAKVTACAIRIISPAFDRSGETLKIERR